MIKKTQTLKSREALIDTLYVIILFLQNDNIQESIAMIITDTALEWVPHGRDVVTRHPRFNTDDEEEGVRLGAGGASLLEDDDLDIVSGSEDWMIDGGEELYTRDNVAVLSAGGQTVSCFSLRSQIKQSVRCRFHEYPDLPRILSTPVSPEPEGESLASVCIRDEKVLRVFTDDGKHFNVALQFSVRRCWSTKFGLLVERQVVSSGHKTDVEDVSRHSNVLFFLLHPLDDYTIVIMKQGQRTWELQDNNHVLIYTSVEPSLAVTYNVMSDTHSVWRIRRATQSEAETHRSSNQELSTGVSGASSAFTSCTPSRHQSTHTNSPSQSRSLGTPFHSRQGTPIHSR